MFERDFGISQKQKSTIFGAIYFGAVRYLGVSQGLSATSFSEIYFYEDRFEIETNHISVHYSKIKEITNSNEMKRDTECLAYGSVTSSFSFGLFMEKGKGGSNNP